MYEANICLDDFLGKISFWKNFVDLSLFKHSFHCDFYNTLYSGKMLSFLCNVLLLQQHFNRSGPSVLKTKYWTTIVDNYMAFKASIQCVSTGLKYVY